MRELDHASSTKTSSQIGRASQDITEMVIVHKIFSHALKDISNDAGGFCEAIEDSMYVVSFLHRDNSRVVLFVDPNKEVAGFVVEDTTSVGPVAATS